MWLPCIQRHVKVEPYNYVIHVTFFWDAIYSLSSTFAARLGCNLFSPKKNTFAALLQLETTVP